MMEEPREQQPPSPPPPQQPPYSQAPPAYNQAAPAYAPPPPPYAGVASARPSMVDMAARVIRLVARRLYWLAEQLWRLLEPRLGWVLLTGFLLGVIGVLGMMLVLPRLLAGRGQPADPRVAALAPAPAVEDFLRGQQTYDADLMWESFSDELRQSLEGRDITRESLAERIENERRDGRRYNDYKYIGGVELGNRQTMYFYAVDVSSPQEQGTISFVFTVDSDGKIVSVE